MQRVDSITTRQPFHRTGMATGLRFRTVSTLFAGILSLPLLQCSRDRTKDLDRISKLIDGGHTSQAITESRAILLEENRRDSVEVARSGGRYHFVSSGDGSCVAWIHGNALEFRKKDHAGELKFDQPPTNLHLTWNCSYGIVYFEYNNECEIHSIFLDRPEIKARIRLPGKFCRPSPLVMENGKRIYFMDQSDLKFVPIDYNLHDAAHVPPALAAAGKGFIPRYKKIPNRFSLFEAPGDSLLLFLGTAGSYRLYRYDETRSRLDYLGDDFAKPFLIFASSVAYPPTETKGNKTETSRTSRDDNPELFVYRGFSGKYILTEIRTRDRFQANNLYPAEPLVPIQFLPGKGRFLTAFHSYLTLWDPRQNRREFLPLLTERFALFDGGLLYEEVDHSLRIRTAPFSETEMKLIALERKALKKAGEKEKINGKKQ